VARPTRKSRHRPATRSHDDLAAIAGGELMPQVAGLTVGSSLGLLCYERIEFTLPDPMQERMEFFWRESQH
jgi:hypothetical protein